MNFAAPRAGLPAAALDELLEPLEVAFHAPAVGAERAAELLLEPFGLVLHANGDLRVVPVERQERDEARVAVATGCPPGDAGVRLLLGDLGHPLTALAAYLGDPAQVRVVDLLDRLNALHEVRKVLELRPLVVCRTDGHIDFDRFFDHCHVIPLPRLLVFAYPPCGTENGLTTAGYAGARRASTRSGVTHRPGRA